MSASTTDFFVIQSVANVAGVAWGDGTIVHVATGLKTGKTVGGGHVLFNKAGTGILEYSYDNANTHGELDPADATKGLTFDNRVRGDIYFRVKAGSAASSVRVDAWVA